MELINREKEEVDIVVKDQDGKEYHFDTRDDALAYIQNLQSDSYSKSESIDAYNKMVQIDSSFVEGLDIAKDDLIGILKNYTSEVSGVIFGQDENGNDIIDEGFQKFLSSFIKVCFYFCDLFIIILYLFIYLLSFLGLHPWHMERPRLRV